MFRRLNSSSRLSVSSSRRRRHAPLLIEAVEPRRLLAASLNGNVLQITGTSGADAYTVKLNGTNLVVQRAGEAAQSFAKSAVAKIVANLGNGNDSILIDDNVNTPASLSGEAGNDTLRGGTGRDTIDGGSGWDTVTYAGRAAAISASVKMTIVHDYNPTTDVYVNYPNGNGTGGTGSEADSYRGIETIVGGAGNDTLTLSGDAPYYPGGGPTLSWTPLRGEGGGGNDQFKINSGFTSDEAARIITIVADGGDGNDSFDFGDNRDPWISVSLYGGAGNDSFHGTTFDGGYSLIDGGAGTDLLTFHSLSRKDYTLPAGVENFTFNNDGTGLTITGNGLDNVITINGNPTGSTVRGGGGNDTIRVLGTGFGGNNAFYGEAGNDTIIGSAYDDLIDGGDGLDTVSYAGRAAPISANVTMTVTFDYDPETDARTYIFDGNGTGGSGDEGDTYRFIEAIVGGAGNDSITLRDDVYYYDGMRPEEPIVVLRGEGGGGDDLFWVSTGTRGRDAARGVVGIVADGGVGNDSFGYSNDGGPGATLIGGDGDDTFSKGNDDATVSSIVAGAGTDTWQMYSGAYRAYVMAPGLENFVATGSFSNGVVWGNELDNTITVGAGGTVRGFGGNDRITITDGTATSFVYGDAGNDTIIGGNGRDEISGGDGDDSLAGNAGDDALYGDAGNDRLDPGTGNDSVAGGAGGGDALVYSSRGVPVTATVVSSVISENGKTFVRNTMQATLTQNGVAESDYGVDVEVLATGGGNDTLTAYANDGAWSTSGLDRSSLILNGGWGDDTINVRGVAYANGTFANTPPVIAFGGDGNDTLTARATTAAKATLDGGNGDDVLGYAGAVGYFTAVGGAGRDTLRIFDRSNLAAALTVTLPGDVEDATVEAGARVDVVGNALANRITVNAPGTSVQGLGGNDTIVGSNSADTLDGGEGDDSILGNGGNDALYGYAGNDRLFGGGGLDKLYGGIGNDFLDGGLGVDSLYGEAGSDTAVRDWADLVDSVEAFV